MTSIPPPPAETTNVAVQLIEFNRQEQDTKSTIKLNDELFQRLVTQAGDRPVSVICICGPSRQGKSFLLGYMVRCLEALENDESDWMDWENRSKPLKGFKFENGVNPVTQGIWVWNRPFMVKNDEGKEIAVLLVDTQGTNDEYTTPRDMSAIVGLSLLVSSVTIFNFFNNLQEDILSALNMFVQYGLVAMENVEGSPFQKLMFVIRDWNMPGCYAYGGEGGKKLIEDKLKVKPGQPAEVVQVREMIRKCFDDVDCFLLPHIGEKAITNEDFSGSIGELSPHFAKKMEEFISGLISSDTLVLKRVLGNPVTVSELKSFLDVYVGVFNSNEVPSASNMWEATSDAHLITLVGKSEKKFVEFMKKRQRGSSYLSEEELESALSRGERQAVEMFRKEKKFVGKEKADTHELELVGKLEKVKDGIKRQNEEKRDSFVAGAVIDAATQFRVLLEETVGFDDSDPFHFHEESGIRRAAKPAMFTVIEDFKEKLMNENEESVMCKEQTVRSILASTLETHVGKNALRRAAAEGEMQKIVEVFAKAYHEQLTNFFGENQFSDFEEFACLVGSVREDCVKAFEERDKPGTEGFQKSYVSQLEKRMGEACTNLKNSHKLKLQEFQSNVDKFIAEACDLYSNVLREEMRNVGDEEIAQIHVCRVEKAMKSFENDGNPYPEGHPKHLESKGKLESKLEGVFKAAVEEAAKAKKRVEESYRGAVGRGLEHYLRKMRDVTGSCDIMVEEDLQVEHERVVNEAVEFYEGIEKLGVLANASDFTQDLVDGCGKEFEKIKVECHQKQEHAKLLAENTVNECVNKYEELMKGSTDKSRSLVELDLWHQNGVRAAKELFVQKFPGKTTPGFIQTHEHELDETIGEVYKQLKSIFNMRVKVEEASIKTLLVDCTNFYHDQMRTHVQNDMFLMPQVLLEHHTSAVNSVVQRLCQRQPLTLNQKIELKREMEVIFHSKYRVENDMKLNYRNRGEPPAIGIDLGTTYCCVGVFLNGEVIIIPNQKQGGNLTTPSFVAYESDGSVTVGAPAKENAFRNPENTIFDAKRIIGRRVDDEKLRNDMVCWPFSVVCDKGGVPKIRLSSGRLLYPEEVSSELLKECREIAEDYLKLDRGAIKKAVITVPAYFEDGQRNATVSAGRLAGLEVLTILNEPTAAAIAYSQKRRDVGARKVLIFDMGGGTFDVAVLDVRGGEIEVLGVSGDTHLGGEDFDCNLMRYCAGEFKRRVGVDLLVGKDSVGSAERYDATRTMRRLQMYCENSKKCLSTARSVEVSVDAITRGLDLNVSVSREVFEGINGVYFSKSVEIVEEALRSVGVSKESVDDVVLVGGSTRIPRIQELLVEFFGGKALNRSIHPDQAVAYGAAVKAAMLNGESLRGVWGLDGLVIRDVTPFPLGVEVLGERLSVIIPKNSKIPTKWTKDYYTVYDGQTCVTFRVYQGEDLEIVTNNKLLGEFRLTNIPPAPNGAEPLDVTMEINEMGILEVTAVIRSTRESKRITIKENRQGMSKREVDRILGQVDPAA